MGRTAVLGMAWLLSGAATMWACAGSEEDPPAPFVPDSGGGDDEPDLGGSTSAGPSGTTTSGGNPSTGTGAPMLPCPYEGPPVVDPSTLGACPAAVCGGGAHCVPKDLVPSDQQASLADCDAVSKCVPDPFIATVNNYVPPTCATVFNTEGRCLSTCLPQVAAQAESLAGASGCGQHEVCAPCYDPFDPTKATGACEQSCDPGPANPAPAPLPSCCEAKATCVPKAAIPDAQEDKLDGDDCDADGENGPASLCVPNELLDPGWQPTVKCETGFLIQLFKGSEYKEGGCLPGCLGAVQQFGISQGDCPDGYKCAPCKDPNNDGAPTGACPWMQP